MAISLVVPEWLRIKCHDWQDRLQMDEWTIGVNIALVVMDDPEARASAQQQPDISFGLLTFRADVEDNREWEVVIVHELLHIKHSRIDNYIDTIVMPRLQSVDMDFGYLVYKSVIEPYTQSMAEAMVKMKEDA